MEPFLKPQLLQSAEAFQQLEDFNVKRDPKEPLKQHVSKRSPNNGCPTMVAQQWLPSNGCPAMVPVMQPLRLKSTRRRGRVQQLPGNPAWRKTGGPCRFELAGIHDGFQKMTTPSAAQAQPLAKSELVHQRVHAEGQHGIPR